MRVAKAANIIKILEDQVLLLFGVPKTLVCDNGKPFVSKELKRITRCQMHPGFILPNFTIFGAIYSENTFVAMVV